MRHGFRTVYMLRLLAGALAIPLSTTTPTLAVAVQRPTQIEIASKTEHAIPEANENADKKFERASAGFPNATNTGVPAGTSLTNYTGPMTITKAGTVIENQIINGSLRITAPDVVIKNCVIKFNGMWGIDADGAKNVTVQNCDIIGPGKSGDSNSGILGSGTFIGNDISNSENGIALGSGASIVRGNYIHDLADGGTDPHLDGIAMHGGQNGVLIEGNTIIGTNNSDIWIKDDFGSIANVTVTNNLLLGNAGYPVYADAGGPGGSITGISVTNNYIEKGTWGWRLFDRGAQGVYSGNVEYPHGQAPLPGGGVEFPAK